MNFNKCINISNFGPWGFFFSLYTHPSRRLQKSQDKDWLSCRIPTGTFFYSCFCDFCWHLIHCHFLVGKITHPAFNPQLNQLIFKKCSCEFSRSLYCAQAMKHHWKCTGSVFQCYSLKVVSTQISCEIRIGCLVNLWIFSTGIMVVCHK